MGKQQIAARVIPVEVTVDDHLDVFRRTAQLGQPCANVVLPLIPQEDLRLDRRPADRSRRMA